MTLQQEQLDTIRGVTGASSVPSEVPHGHTLVGAINSLERIATEMEEYGLTYSDLPSEKQQKFDNAHEDLQFHIKLFGNLFAQDLVGADTDIELPSGKTVDLPLQATAAGSNSANIPNNPMGGN